MGFMDINFRLMATCIQQKTVYHSFSGNARTFLLSLHASGTVSAHESLDLGLGDQVEIAFDRVLQAGSRYSELQSLLIIGSCHERIDQSAAEAVAAAYAVNDRHRVLFGLIEFILILAAFISTFICRPKKAENTAASDKDGKNEEN